MIRRLFTLLSGLSLVLGVTTCVLWVRSNASGHREWWCLGSDFTFAVYRGKIELGQVVILHTPEPAEYTAEATPEWVRSRPHQSGSWLGFAYEWGENVYESGESEMSSASIPAGQPGHILGYWRTRAVAAPAWAVVGLLAVPPAFWLRQYCRTRLNARRAARQGLCPGCGYDLRASPGRCPECGAVPAVKGAA
jgi:hypothetical protein